MSDYIRRLPVYLLIDCSGSMAGEPIEAVKQGIKALLSELKGDPQALETACLSVITFDSTARQVTPLTELMLFTSRAGTDDLCCVAVPIFRVIFGVLLSPVVDDTAITPDRRCMLHNLAIGELRLLLFFRQLCLFSAL